MNRWTFLLTALLASAAVHAQFIRTAPSDVKPARMVITAPPQITLDGKPDRLSPGSRIRNTQNLVLMSGGLAGQELPVVYRRDSAGLVHEVWVLTADEYAKVAGASDGTPEGEKRLADLLGRIFGARR